MDTRQSIAWQGERGGMQLHCLLRENVNHLNNEETSHNIQIFALHILSITSNSKPTRTRGAGAVLFRELKYISSAGPGRHLKKLTVRRERMIRSDQPKRVHLLSCLNIMIINCLAGAHISHLLQAPEFLGSRIWTPPQCRGVSWSPRWCESSSPVRVSPACWRWRPS